ncbi:MAG: glycine--tRNA ligase subunit beta [Pseudomonadota bacterium]
MSAELLLEIGTEEIPSGYLKDGLEALKRLAGDTLKESRVQVKGGLQTYGTPRRLILAGRDVAAGQEDMVQEITGPPKGAAFDAQGDPTKAAAGFAKKQGVSVGDLQIIETPRGEYLYVKRFIPGRPTREVLSELLPRLIGALTWPKSMRWGSTGYSFVRPIHWILALFDGQVVPFEVAGIRSGDTTRGHRFMTPEVRSIKNLQDYMDAMANGFVIIDQEEREKTVEEAVMKVSQTLSAKPNQDPELLSTVANLVEFPFAVCGGFEEKFLDLPEAVLVTAMKEHQKYFSLYDREGRLMPNFVAVNNTRPRNESVVRKGHEKVLRARLADAAFFFDEDRKRPLQERLEDLKGVIYQAELGTSFEKVQRFTRLAAILADQVAPEKKESVRLAAGLSKCDLVTEMVMEFPSLQGIMGETYALLDGHPEEVCEAIRAHYLPVRAGGELPASIIGAVVGVADRMDSIAGCFAIQLEPTGAADPFALRRHALAIIRILGNFGWHISLENLIGESLSILREGISFDQEQVTERMMDFFRDRFKYMMIGSGYESDLVEAVISAKFDAIDRLPLKIDHLKKFMVESDEFEALVLTSKRVNNILKKEASAISVDPGLFREPCEAALWESFQDLKEKVSRAVEQGDYFGALNILGALRKPVDDLFDGVEILTRESPELRNNRVGLLQSLSRLFLGLADFSKFSI